MGLEVEEAADLFAGVEIEVAEERLEQSAEAFLGFLRTTSFYFGMDRAHRVPFDHATQGMFEQIGGSLHSTWLFTLVTAVTHHRRGERV